MSEYGFGTYGLALYGTSVPVDEPGPTTRAAISNLALPFRYSNGRPAVVEQDSHDDILACVEAILRYPIGFRPELPEFGIDDPTFAMGEVDVDEIAGQIEEWEPRAAALIDEQPDLLEQLVRRVSAGVSGGDDGGLDALTSSSGSTA